MRVHLLSLAIIGAQGFSALQKKPVDTIPVGTLCDELVRFANLGCGEATPEQDKRDCEAEMKRHSTSGTMFGLDDAQAALDAVPQELFEELEQVDVVSKCVRDEVRRIVALDVEARLTQHKRALESPDGGYVAILAIVYGRIKTVVDNGGNLLLFLMCRSCMLNATFGNVTVRLPCQQPRSCRTCRRPGRRLSAGPAPHSSASPTPPERGRPRDAFHRAPPSLPPRRRRS